ncbi:DUF6338 family protein [Hydrocarboniphaga sp.]|uniref:DUF6338 family protein n=1 Tax=Hydrocarboniphaga sp. TaxID=2033016 RepID=UPI0034572287
MPEELGKDVVALLAYLLPGFVAGWVYYGLTSHPKPSQFKRVVQALILTLIIQAITPALQWCFELIGQLHSFRPWDQYAAGLTTLALGFSLGTGMAYLTATPKNGLSTAAGDTSTSCSQPGLMSTTLLLICRPWTAS